VYGPQCNSAELDVVSAFENISDIALLKLTVGETNRYAQQKILENVSPCTFYSRIRKWEDVTVDKIYVVLAVFMSWALYKSLHLDHITQRTGCQPFCFFLDFPLERVEVMIKFMHFFDS
jgi:hypothetical protein